MRTKKDVRFVYDYPLNVRQADLRPTHDPVPPTCFLTFTEFLIPPVPTRHLEKLGRCADEQVHGMARSAPGPDLKLAVDNTIITSKRRVGHLCRRHARLGPAGNIRA